MRRALLLLLWLLSDLAIFAGSYILSYFLRVGWIVSTDFPLDRFAQTVMLTAPVTVAVLAALGVFRLMRNQNTPRNIMHIVFACLLGSAFFTLAYYFVFTAFFSRLLLVYAFILSSFTLTVWHIGFERMMRWLLRAGRPVYPTLIIGATREAARLIESLQKHRHPLTPVAVLDGRGTSETAIHGIPVEGKLNKLEETLKKHRISHLIQCSDIEQSINLLSACRNRDIVYMLLPSVLGMIENDERIETLEGQQVTTVRPGSQFLGWFFG